MRRTIATLAAVGVVAAACTAPVGEGTTTPAPAAPWSPEWATTPLATLATLGVLGAPSSGALAVAERFDPARVRFVAALERFDSCDALLAYFKEEALARVGPYGLDFGGVYPYPWRVGVAFAEGADGASAPATTVAALSPVGGADTGFSGSNVQVAGVDEPDIVKTDGRRILAVSNGNLYYVEVEDGNARLVGSLALEGGWDHRLFMAGERALVFSTGDANAVPMPLLEAGAILRPWSGPVTLIQEIDLSEPSALRVARTLRVGGRYLSARAVEGTVRVVISSYPADLPFVYPSGPAAEDLAAQTNRRVIEQSTLEDWLPSYTLFAGGEVMSRGLLPDCEETHHPVEFAGFDTLAVLTLDLDGRLSVEGGTAVIAQGETVYASGERLYVATNVWVPQVLIGDGRLAPIEEDYSSAVHAFDISSGGPARYLASGSVDGHLLNQFAMDEQDGYLRVATTDGPPWGFAETSESAVAVLEVDGGRLVEVGRVGDLGRGERIYSVRFVGDTGYVVTFRQTDPLYVIDLTDPTAPRVSGELKIAGYSAYLHPLGDGRLLGVGRDATEEGFTTGAKVSLFDVADPSRPREIDTWTLADGYTDVEWDHLAFLYWAPEQIAVLPMQDWSGGFVGAVVLKTDDGLRRVGSITHAVAEAGYDSGCRPVEVPGYGAELRIQVCGRDDRGGSAGYWCEVLPQEELGSWLDQAAATGVEIGPDERVEICWREDNAPPILRSLVIGENLWTLSWTRLQGNDLDGFEVVDRVDLG